MSDQSKRCGMLQHVVKRCGGQQLAAAEIGVSQQSVSRWLRGESPISLLVEHRLAEILKRCDD